MRTGFIIFTSLMLMHLIADFFLQSREMGQKKSSSFKMLAKHGFVHFLTFFFGLHTVMMVFAYLNGGFWNVAKLFFIWGIMSFILAFINAVLHMVVDATTWNAYKYFKYLGIKRRANKAYPNGPEDIVEDRIQKDIELAKLNYHEDPWFYHTIGIDQCLHMITIAFVYQWAMMF